MVGLNAIFLALGDQYHTRVTGLFETKKHKKPVVGLNAICLALAEEIS